MPDWFGVHCGFAFVTQPLIEVQNLRYAYPGGQPALNGVSFRLETNESVALLGANGSGKTTFVLHLAGLLHGEGSIRIAGEELTAQSAGRLRKLIGLVFQESDDQLFLPTVFEDVAFGPANYGAEAEQARQCALRALEATNITHLGERAPYHLSSGEKKRAAIAGVLALEPEILILDEPTTSLDPPGRRKLVDLLRSLPQSKVVVTHDVEFAKAVAHRAVFFDAGRVAGEGSVADIAVRFDWNGIS